MDIATKIAIVRDIFLIVSAGIFIGVLSVTGLLVLRVYRRLYPAVQRTTENLEASSNIILSLLTHPLNFVTTILDSVNRVVSLVEAWRERKGRPEDKEEDEEGGEST